MKIVATADLHGNLPSIPECDLLIIAGDLVAPDCISLDAQRYWLKDKFDPWITDAPARNKFVVPGNHDVFLQHAPSHEIPGAVLFIDQGTSFDGIAIWGTPWTKPFPPFAFTAPDDVLELHWNRIPKNTQILVSHGPPASFGDRVKTGEHVGSQSLLRRISSLPLLRYVICGHIHESVGAYTFNGISILNVSQTLNTFEI